MRTLLVVLACLAYASAQIPFTVGDCASYCGNISNSAVACGIAPANVWTHHGYADQNACTAVCSAMALAVGTSPLGPYNFAGNINATTGNTMGCRLYHIGFAIATNDSSHCAHASIHGGGQCGATSADYCGTYCTLTGAFCPEAFGGTYNPPTNPNYNGTFCALMCAGVYNFGTNNSMPVVQGGDNFACRFYHLSAAAVLRTTDYTHCAHASPLGGNVCRTGSGATGSEARIFCSQVQAQCTLGNAQYTDNADCLSDAALYDRSTIGTQFGNVNSTTGDTLGCRFYHSGLPVTTAGASVHCPHAGWVGGTAAQCGVRPSTAAPTTAAPTTAAPTGGASSVLASVLVVLAALMLALF